MNSMILLLFLVIVSPTYSLKSDVGLSALQIIENHGYASETHKIQSEDGYILTYYRILPKFQNQNLSVLLVAGFASSGATYITSGEHSLAFVLAAHGYDVWLQNSRGTTGLQNHTTLNPITEKEKYFDYTLHEFGYYDLPAAIDYILNLTNRSSLEYIAHSMGCLHFLVMCSARPEYNHKIRLAHLLAPSIINRHGSGTNKALGEMIVPLEDLAYNIGLIEAPFLSRLKPLFVAACMKSLFLCKLSQNLFNFDIELEIIPIIFTHFPTETSMRQRIQIDQWMRTGKYQQYDFGTTKNLLIYGSEKPPEYNLSQITAPVAIYYSTNDRIINFQHIKIFQDELPNVVEECPITEKGFTHIDFVYSTTAYEIVYKKLLAIMQKY